MKVNPTLADCISALSFERVMNAMKADYPDEEKNISGYESAYAKLKAMTPIESDMLIDIEMCHEDADPKYGTEASDYINVCGLSSDGQYYSIEFKPWAEWLGMHFTLNTLESFTEERVVASCLWEMTFHGYDDNDVQDRWTSIQNTVDEIKANN